MTQEQKSYSVVQIMEDGSEKTLASDLTYEEADLRSELLSDQFPHAFIDVVFRE